MSFEGEIGVFDLLEELIELLRIRKIDGNITKLMDRRPLNHIYVYPDGYIWNLPWPYLVDSV